MSLFSAWRNHQPLIVHSDGILNWSKYESNNAQCGFGQYLNTLRCVIVLIKCPPTHSRSTPPLPKWTVVVKWIRQNGSKSSKLQYAVMATFLHRLEHLWDCSLYSSHFIILVQIWCLCRCDQLLVCIGSSHCNIICMSRYVFIVIPLYQRQTLWT